MSRMLRPGGRWNSSDGLSTGEVLLLGLAAVFCLWLTSCVTQTKVQAAIWLNNSPIPAEICTREPALKDHGFYRRLDTGQLEFVSFCDPKSAEWLSMFKEDFNRLMDEAGLPKKFHQP